MKPLTLRAAAAILAAFLLFSACSREIPSEPSVSASVTEITTRADVTTSAPAEETTAEDETTASSDGTETTEEEETTEPAPSLENLSPEELIIYALGLRSEYSSYILSTETYSEIDVGDETEASTSRSTLSISAPNASYLAAEGDLSSEYYLYGGELYTKGARGSYRIGGYNVDTFCEFVGDLFPLTLFTDGAAEKEGEFWLLSFSGVSDEGKKLIVSLLSLPDGCFINLTRSEMTAKLDSDGNLIESLAILEIEIRDEEGDSLMMNLLLESKTSISSIGETVSVSKPDSSAFTYFPDLESVRRFEAALDSLDEFKSNRDAFEFIHTDNISVVSKDKSITPTSRTTYAYDKKVGASIDKFYDVGDGTGKRTSLTHYNFRRSFSMLDGGSIFVDTTLDASNLFFTLFYPIDTSFFSLGSYTALDTKKSTPLELYFDLDGDTAVSIAQKLLLRAGVYTSSPALSAVSAKAYLITDENGCVTAIGYDYSATATVKGEEYKLTRRVRVDITSRTNGNVKVIYIEVEDDGLN